MFSLFVTNRAINWNYCNSWYKNKSRKKTHTEREKQKLDIKLTDRYERLNKPEITSTSNLDLNQRKEIVHINFSGALMCKIDFKCIPDYCCAFGFTTVRRTQFSKWKKKSKYRTTQIDIVTPYVEFQHNRPINPISTRDYFRLLSFFSILLLNQWEARLIFDIAKFCL